MGSISCDLEKPHAVCVTFPTQSHINAMLHLAKLLYVKGFHITFVNTEFNHRRLQRSRGPESLRGLPDFRFETIPDGLPPSDADATQDIAAICHSTTTTCLGPLMDLVARLNDTAASNVPPVSCIVTDGVMSFAILAAEQLGIPSAVFWPTSPSGTWGFMQFSKLVEKGYVPFKDEDFLTNGCMETELEWVKGMKGVRLRDISSFMRTTDPDDILLNFFIQESERSKRATIIVINTFDALDHDVIMALQSELPPVYSIGPLPLFLPTQIKDDNLRSLASNLWKEDTTCLQWLDTKEPNSVVYVNFGSIAVLTPSQLVEFAWGFANSKKPFLWIVRPDLVTGEGAVLPPEFLEETKDRAMLTSWCAQEQVLAHPAVGGFLTHCGWNSTLESICSGVPLLCWPFFGDQPPNCWQSCKNWGIGMEIENNVKRDQVEKLVREILGGEKGREMKRKAMELKRLANETVDNGTALENLEKIIDHLLLHHNK